jgi:hypothetical protein
MMLERISRVVVEFDALFWTRHGKVPLYRPLLLPTFISRD